jgi:hypothetical protein
MAWFNASSTKLVVIEVETRQPTILRAKTSMMKGEGRPSRRWRGVSAPNEAIPAHVDTQVKSLAHCPRTMYGWLPRGKSVSVEAGVISVAAIARPGPAPGYTASRLQHGGCAP